MENNFDQILNSEFLSDEVKQSISEAWNSKVQEIRDEVTAELREEFAARYENDKSQIVSAMDAMMTDTIKEELEEFSQDKKALQEDRVAYRKAIREHAKKLDEKISETLKKEITELKEDRNKQKKNVAKLEEFVINKLTEELNEFHTDKKALVEQRVRLANEGKRVIQEARAQFIKNAASKVNKIVENTLRSEITTLKEDIQTAKENNFGRKIFETFAAEFMTSALSEGTQISKLSRKINELDNKLQESNKLLSKKDKAIMEAERKAKIAKDLSNRKAIMNELLSPLNKEQREVMTSLLESVKTEKLRTAYDKYLPTILTEDGKSSANMSNTSTKKKAKLTEGNKNTVLTGDRASGTQAESEGSAEIIRMRKLAGIS